jgi:predicted TIM-barrel fold metal-dependent hydrolase
MIVDAHVHLYNEGWVPKAFLRGVAQIVCADIGKASGEYADPDQFIAGTTEEVQDPAGDALIADMNEAGVDVSVIFPVDFALASDEPSSAQPECVPIAEQNRICGEAARRHGNRLFHLVSVDPRRKDAVALLETGVREQNARGLKLHTAAGFYPDDPVCYPLYRKAQELGVPVMFHTGVEPAPLKVKYSRPVFLDGVCADFPDLKIVMAHAGHCWWEEALAIAGSKWNLYIDLSDWQRTFLYHPNKFYNMLRCALDEIGPWRVMYASDNPPLILPSKKWVEAVRDAVKSKEFAFSNEEMDIVMGPAAARLFKIS